MSVNKRYPLPSANYGHAQPWNSAINAEPLPAIFERQAQAIPNTVLAEFMGRDFTYRELYAEARRFAAGLIDGSIDNCASLRVLTPRSFNSTILDFSLLTRSAMFASNPQGERAHMTAISVVSVLFAERSKKQLEQILRGKKR